MGRGALQCRIHLPSTSLMLARQADTEPTIGTYSRAVGAGDLSFVAGTTAGGSDAEPGAGLDGIFGESFS